MYECVIRDFFERKVKFFSVEDDGLLEALYAPELLVPSGETECKEVQREIAVRVSFRSKSEYFSAEDISLIEVLHCPELAVSHSERVCKVM